MPQMLNCNLRSLRRALTPNIHFVTQKLAAALAQVRAADAHEDAIAGTIGPRRRV